MKKMNKTKANLELTSKKQWFFPVEMVITIKVILREAISKMIIIIKGMTKCNDDNSKKSETR